MKKVKSKKSFEEYFNNYAFIKWVTKKHWFNLGFPFSKKFLYIWGIISAPLVIYIFYVMFLDRDPEVILFLIFCWPGIFILHSLIKVIKK